MNFGERLKFARNVKKLNQTELGKLVGVGQSYISELEKLETAPNTDLKKLSEALSVSIEYLTGEDASKLPDVINGAMNVSTWDDSTLIPSDMVAIPFYKEVELSAGNGSSCIIEQDNGRRLWFARSFLDRRNAVPENVVCLPIVGESMSPRLEDGGVVVVDTGCKKLKDGEVFAINYKDHLYIKKIRIVPGSTVDLVSENPAYDDVRVDIQDIIVIGKIINYMKEL